MSAVDPDDERQVAVIMNALALWTDPTYTLAEVLLRRLRDHLAAQPRVVGPPADVLSQLLRQASLEVFHLRLLLRQRGGRRATPVLLTRKTVIRDWLVDRIRDLEAGT